MRLQNVIKFFRGVNTFRHGRLLAGILFTTVLLTALTGCIGTDYQTPVGDSAVTQTPENVARVFAESVFSGDYEKMLSCFPAEYTDSLAETDLTSLKAWSDETIAANEKNDTEYLGTSSGEAQLFSEDTTTSDYKNSLASISLSFGIASTDIEELRYCNVRVFCNIGSDKKFQDTKILVYKYNANWYASINADSGIPEEA